MGQWEPGEEETAGGMDTKKGVTPELVDSGADAAMPAVLTQLDGIGSLI